MSKHTCPDCLYLEFPNTAIITLFHSPCVILEDVSISGSVAGDCDGVGLGLRETDVIPKADVDMAAVGLGCETDDVIPKADVDTAAVWLGCEVLTDETVSKVEKKVPKVKLNVIYTVGTCMLQE